MSRSMKQKKICKQGHIFYKSSDCSTCLICDKEKLKAGIFADMGSPVRRALDHARIKTLKQLARHTEQEILNMHGVGPSSMQLFKKKLKNDGFSFKNKLQP